MNTTPQWISTKFKREDLHAKPVHFKDDSGRDVEGVMEVEKVNDQGQMIVRVCYNPGPYAGTVMLTAFRLTQEQMNQLVKDGDRCVLKC